MPGKSYGLKLNYEEDHPMEDKSLEDQQSHTSMAGLSCQVHIVADRPKVLLVDDDHYFLEFLSTALNERFDVITADNGATALELFIEQRPSLVITDICMPRMSGFELIRALKNHPPTPIIAVSGYEITQSNYDAASLIEETVVKVIRKPCSILEVFQAAEQYVLKAS